MKQARPIIGRTGTNWLGLWTLYSRELMRFRRFWAETLAGPAASTALFLGVVALAIGPEREGLVGGDYLTFLGPFLVMLQVLMLAAQMPGFSVLQDKLEGTINDILAAPLTAGEVTIAFALGGASGGLLAGCAALPVAWLIADLSVAAPWAVVFFPVAGAILLGAFGLIAGLWAEKWDHFALAFELGLYPALFLSGGFVPVTALPDWAQAVVRANPAFYAIDGFRYGFTGTAESPPAVSALVLLAADAALLWLAHRLIRSGWRLRP